MYRPSPPDYRGPAAYMEKLRIYIDLGHPAHAHAMRFFIEEMKRRGHRLLITARDKDITFCLLRAWGIEFTGRGRGISPAGGWFRKMVPAVLREGVLLGGKFLNLVTTTMRLYPRVKKFKPDLVLSWCSYHAALIGRLLGKPVITFEDTENVPFLHTINRLLSTSMVTPACFEKKLGNRHIRFNGYKELASLHPGRFAPDPLPRSMSGPYIVLRFVSWQAYHDRGHKGISPEMKILIVKRLSRFARVYISSEIPLPPELMPYRLPVSCEMGHQVLNKARLFFGESASMAAEAAVLGVPSIYIDNTGRGYTRELEKYGLLFNFGEEDDSVQKALDKAVGLLGNHHLDTEWKEKQKTMLEGKEDVTSWMVRLAESSCSDTG